MCAGCPPLRSGDWLYQVVEVLSLALVLVSIYLTAFMLKATYNKKLDKFGNGLLLPDNLAALWVFIPALLLALVRTGVVVRRGRPPHSRGSSCAGAAPPPEQQLHHGRVLDALRVHRGGCSAAPIVHVPVAGRRG